MAEETKKDNVAEGRTGNKITKITTQSRSVCKFAPV